MFTIIAFFFLAYLVDRFIYTRITWPRDEPQLYREDNLVYKDLYLKMHEDNSLLWLWLRNELGPLCDRANAGSVNFLANVTSSDTFLDFGAPSISDWRFRHHSSCGIIRKVSRLVSQFYGSLFLHVEVVLCIMLCGSYVLLQGDLLTAISVSGMLALSKSLLS